MKSLITFRLVLVVTSLLACSVGFSQEHESGGVRGGERVKTARGWVLRDFANPGACLYWKTGSELLQERSGIQKIIAAISKRNWYIASDLQKKLERLDFCFTMAELQVPDTRDQDQDVFVYSGEFGDVVALRKLEESEVAVNIPKKDTLTLPFMQDFLYLHEAEHSYYPPEDKKRYRHLSELNTLFMELVTGKPVTDSRFEITLTKNLISVPDAGAMQKDRAFLTYLFADNSARREMLLKKQTTPEYLLKTRSFGYRQGLSDSDQELIQAAMKDLPHTLFGDYCRTGDQEMITLLSSTNLGTFDMGLLCLTYPEFSKFPSTVRQVLQGASFQKYLDQIYQHVAKTQFFIRGDRIVVTEEAQFFSQKGLEPATPRIALSLKGVDRSDQKHWDALSVQYLKLMSLAAEHLSPEEWTQLFFSSASFNRAFNKMAWAEKLNTTALNAAIPREKQNVLEHMNYLQKHFLDALISAVSKQNAASALLMVQKINGLNLGYSVEYQE